MIRRASIASLIATVASAMLVSASTEGRSQDYPAPTDIEQIRGDYATIVQQGTANTASVEQRDAPLPYFGGGSSGASEASLYSAAIFQNGSDHQAGVRQYGSSDQATIEATIDQDGTSNSAQVLQWGKSLSADVQQDGDNHAVGINQFGQNLAVEIDQSGDNKSFHINQFGQGTGLPVTVRQY